RGKKYIDMDIYESLDPAIATELAAAHLSVLLSAGAVPEDLGGSRIEPEGTAIYDTNGTILFRRSAIIQQNSSGYLDVAASPAMGALLVAIAPGAQWQPERLLEEARAALQKNDELNKQAEQYDEIRFAAYSFPKLAVQFLREGKEVALLELHSWEPIPEARVRKQDESPSNFERWSYIDELPESILTERIAKFETMITEFTEELTRFDRERYAITKVDIESIFRLVESRELHYSLRNADHSVCYELRGQETSVWCVAASVQMVLDFYRFGYSQERIAADLGLGTPSNPSGLPYGNEDLVVTVLEALTSSALDATNFSVSDFSLFRAEILANRPLISFIPGHSRTVVGFTDSSWIFSSLGFRGLCVFDPWPPNSGVITRWENYDASSYRNMFTAHVTLV
ncbi:MAG: C39 family peptidase, partial [Rhodoglobus sp.]